MRAAPRRSRSLALPRRLPAGSLPVPGARGQHPDLRPLRRRLQPAVRLHRPAVVRPRGLLRAGAYSAGIAIVALRAAPAGRDRRPLSRRRIAAPSSACSRSAPAASTSRWSRWRWRSSSTTLLYQASAWTGGENGLRGITCRRSTCPGCSLDLLDPLTSTTSCWPSSGSRLWLVSRILPRRSGRDRGDPRERGPGAGLRLRRRAHEAARLRALRRRSAASPARSGRSTFDRADRDAALPHLGPGRDDGLLGGMGTFFGPFVGGRALRARGQARHWTRALAALRRRRLHRSSCCSCRRHLGQVLARLERRMVSAAPVAAAPDHGARGGPADPPTRASASASGISPPCRT